MEWTIDLQMRWPYPPNSWVPAGTVRTTRFIAPDGLFARLDPTRGYFGAFFVSMTLLCLSMDPDINPIPTPNPFDFTIPEG